MSQGEFRRPFPAARTSIVSGLLRTGFALAAMFWTAGGVEDLWAGEPPTVSLTLIPPSRMTDQITLEVRGAVRNEADSPRAFDVEFFLDEMKPGNSMHAEKVEVAGRSSKAVGFHWPTKGHAGRHRIILAVNSGPETHRTDRPLEILASDTRSTKRLAGGWLTILPPTAAYGPSSTLAALAKMTDQQWREAVRNMHQIGLDVAVITEVFRRCSSKALYPSCLGPARDSMAAGDPIEAILSEADELDMHVFLGDMLGSGSSMMRREVATELWQRYGHHRSFYGWYLQEALASRLHLKLAEFREIQTHCRSLAPDKPVMFAPSLEHMPDGYIAEHFPKILKHCDIITVFGFPRHIDWNKTSKANVDRSLKEFQKVCDEAGAHLWWDLETFYFAPKGGFGPGDRLSPQGIRRIVDELQEYTTFETVICYRYTGLLASPDASIQPGGSAAVKLYQDYRQYLKSEEESR